MARPAPHQDFIIGLSDEVLKIVWRPGISIGPAELDVLANTITHFPRWQHRPLLIHLSRIRYIMPPARQMLLAYRHFGPIALMGSDPVDRVLAAFITQSLSRTKYFTDEGEAQEWLSAVVRAADPAGPGVRGPLTGSRR